MSIRFIYGRSGTGKSEYIYKDIKEKINTKEKIYILTPDQFSFMAEKKLLEIAEEETSLNAEVLTFNRMAYRVFSEVYGAAEVNLSLTGRKMLLYNILLEEKNNLTFLKNSEGDIDLVSTTITEFKKHNITEKQLQENINNIGSTYLKAKLTDLHLIYAKYNQKIKDKYIDENDKLTLLVERLEQSSMFKNSLIYIDEFTGFTRQEYNVIEKLLKLAKMVTVTICADELEIKDDKKPENDIFYSNKQTAKELVKYAKNSHCAIEKPLYLYKAYRYKTEELKHLEKNLYGTPYRKYENKINSIALFLCENPYSEIELVAKNIVNLVRNCGYRYKDIAITTKDLQPYASIVKAIFKQYEIPVFMDEKKELSQNAIVKYVLALLDIFAKNWSYEAMFNYIKSGFLDLEEVHIYHLDNYCKKWGIKGSRWYKEDWKWEDEQLDTINTIRKQVIEPLIELKENLSGTKTCKQFCEQLYTFWIKQGIIDKIEQKQEKIKKYNNGNEELWQAFQIILKVLDEMVLVFGEEEITFEKYRDLIKIAMQKDGLGEIPMYMDEVTMGDIERSRSHKVKAIFMIGVNDGSFLNGNMEEGFLSNEDRLTLKQNGMELAKDTLERLYEEQFNVYKAFSTAEEKLYISYIMADKEGNTKRPSILISKLKKIFPNLQEESQFLGNLPRLLHVNNTFEELLEKLRDERDGKNLEEIWQIIFKWYQSNPEWTARLEKAMEGINYTNLPEKIKEKNLKRLYGKDLKTSVSKLEQYRKCPFSFHLKYGLRLKDESSFNLKSIDTGSFMHEVIDDFFEKSAKNKIKIKEISEDEAKKIIEEIIEEKLKINKNYIYTSTPKFTALTNKLKNVIIKSVGYIIYQLKQSDFELKGTEIEFKNQGEYPPMIFKLENGQTVELTGKIDRIDMAKTEDGKCVRIIDYKSSVRNIDLNEVITGLQIQLLTYLDAVTEHENAIPAGMFYFNLLDPIIQADKNKTEEEIEKEIRKKFKMQGLVLADISVVKKMDKQLQKGYSDIIPVYVDKDGNLSEKTGNILKREEFENLQKYGKRLIKQIAEEILSGDIGMKPYYNRKNKKTPCIYCEYKNICGFNIRIKRKSISLYFMLREKRNHGKNTKRKGESQ